MYLLYLHVFVYYRFIFCFCYFFEMNLYTVDSGGITRNIGRDTGTKTHTAVLKEVRTKRDWVWFCSALWRRKDEYEYQYDVFLYIDLFIECSTNKFS